ncbi:MAG: AAC(3) family N-acetyltransferase [Anaerolineae bacterium]|nr:MAG: AAC(3) family N-acetyltransferase [Anaerolineae bacterium]
MQERNVAQRIADNLLALGVRRGGVLLVHVSLSAMGRVAGGAETVIQGLLQALGPEGTLLMPALSYEIVTPENPVFDVLRTPSNVGAVPEFFRTRPGTRRSVHPTHSACGVGPLAEALLGEHILDDTPCGPHSPFRRLRDVGGQILMLGCGLEPNTSMHGIEELVEPPYLFGSMLGYCLVLADGRVQHKIYRPHDFIGWVQRYDRVGALLNQDGLKRGAVLAARTYLLEASALWDAVLTVLRRDPLYFVDRAGEVQA